MENVKKSTRATYGIVCSGIETASEYPDTSQFKTIGNSVSILVTC
jgi:hypothetical protein